MKYRPEIDGLRAIAVIPVILYHSSLEYFGGGFIGVDIFFVISGYLITTILLEDLEKGRLSIAFFYERRARRILPALTCVTLCCVPFAWLWLGADSFRSFSQAMVAVSLFASNIFFWQKSDYFNASTGEMPLLHTWSLAVEEQYYVFFPIFLLFAWKFGRRRVFWLIVVFFTLSLALSEWGWRYAKTANFYLAPTRAWEIFTGSLVAFVAQKQGVRKNNLLSAIGLIAVGYAFYMFNDPIPHPSVYTLIPVGGVALLVLYARYDTLVGRLLGRKALVGVGLISYSLYLWHQPLFAFAKIRSPDVPSERSMVALIGLTFLLAWTSWKFVEQPFRKREQIPRSTLVKFSALALLLPIVIGFAGHLSNGFPAEFRSDRTPPGKVRLTQDFYVIGDSHAGHLVSGLKSITAGTVTPMERNSCIPLRDVDRFNWRNEKGACPSTMNGHLDQIVMDDPDAVIILCSMVPTYLEGTAFKRNADIRVKGHGIELVTDLNIQDPWEIYETGLRRTFTELSHLQRSRVVYAIDIPEIGIDRGCQTFTKKISTPWFELGDNVTAVEKSACGVSRQAYDKRNDRYKKLVYDVAKEFPKIKVFDPTDTFCNEEWCTGYTETFGYLYRDPDHLSKAGSLFWAHAFAEFLHHSYP